MIFFKHTDAFNHIFRFLWKFFQNVLIYKSGPQFIVRSNNRSIAFIWFDFSFLNVNNLVEGNIGKFFIQPSCCTQFECFKLDSWEVSDVSFRISMLCDVGERFNWPQFQMNWNEHATTECADWYFQWPMKDPQMKIIWFDKLSRIKSLCNSIAAYYSHKNFVIILFSKFSIICFTHLIHFESLSSFYHFFYPLWPILIFLKNPAHAFQRRGAAESVSHKSNIIWQDHNVTIFINLC